MTHINAFIINCNFLGSPTGFRNVYSPHRSDRSFWQERGGDQFRLRLDRREDHRPDRQSLQESHSHPGRLRLRRPRKQTHRKITAKTALLFCNHINIFFWVLSFRINTFFKILSLGKYCSTNSESFVENRKIFLKFFDQKWIRYALVEHNRLHIYSPFIWAFIVFERWQNLDTGLLYFILPELNSKGLTI